MEQQRAPEVEEVVVGSEHLKHTGKGCSLCCGHVTSETAHLFVEVAEDGVEQRFAGVQDGVEAVSVAVDEPVVELDDQRAGHADHEQDDQEQQGRRVDRGAASHGDCRRQATVRLKRPCDLRQRKRRLSAAGGDCEGPVLTESHSMMHWTDARKAE